MKYNKNVVEAYFNQCGLPDPVFELRFHPVRRWRFDLAWPAHKVALEVQGGIFSNGRHTRGAALIKEWEKLNTAAAMGWRVIYCQPSDLCMDKTVAMIREVLGFAEDENKQKGE